MKLKYELLWEERDKSEQKNNFFYTLSKAKKIKHFYRHNTDRKIFHNE